MDPNSGNNRPAAQLVNLLGFDPSKPARLSEVLMAEVIGDLRKGKLEEAKTKAKDLLTKAITLQEGKTKADREYEKASKAFDKELGGVIGQIRQLLEGATGEPAAPPDDTASKD